jgi:Tfp pilus assembly protein PilV
MAFKPSKNIQGFALTEIMVASGLAAAVMLAMAGMNSRMNQANLNTRNIATRDQLMRILGRLAGNKSALQKSATFTGANNFPANADMLNKCLNGGTTGGCIANTPFEFTLTDAQGAPAAGISQAKALYDANSTLCGSSSAIPVSKQCSLIATTKFTAICGNGSSANCDQANSIIVTYTVQQASVTPDGVTLLTPQTESVTNNISNSPAAGAGAGTGTPNFLAKWKDSATLGDSSIIDTGSGTVGVNLPGGGLPVAALDVGGGIKITNDTGTCDASRAGTIRYPGKNNAEVCIQTSPGVYVWSTIGVVPGTITPRSKTDTFLGGTPGKNLEVQVACNDDEVVVNGGVRCTDLAGGAGTHTLHIVNTYTTPHGWAGSCGLWNPDSGSFQVTTTAYCMKN